MSATWLVRLAWLLNSAVALAPVFARLFDPLPAKALEAPTGLTSAVSLVLDAVALAAQRAWPMPLIGFLDEPELVDMMRSIIERAGHEVASAESGAVALELLDVARFDAIVSDLRMPDMDGAALWRAVRERDPKLAARMVFVTGDTLSPDVHAFLREQGGFVLDKPFAAKDLRERLDSILARRE